MMRGHVRNREQAGQIVRFDGLRYGSITPTDGDLLLDWHYNCFVLAELKFGDAAVPVGQRLAIERFVDTWERGGVMACGIIARHAQEHRDIIAANSVVDEIRWRGKWSTAARGRGFGEFLKALYDYQVRAGPQAFDMISRSSVA